MKNTAIKFGLMMGFVLVLFNLLVYVINKELLTNGALTMSFGLIIPIVFMYMAIKEKREQEEGFIGFAEALKVSFLVFVVGSIFSVIVTNVLHNMDSELYDIAIKKSLETSEKAMNMLKVPEAQRQVELQKAADINPFTFKMAMLQYSIGLIFPGFILALILSAILKRDNNA